MGNGGRDADCNCENAGGNGRMVKRVLGMLERMLLILQLLIKMLLEIII